MENMTKEQAIEKAAEEYADSIDRRGCAFWRGLNMGYIAGSTASGSVAALKEEVTLGVGDGSGQHFVKGSYDSIKLLQGRLLQLESLSQQLKEREEVLKELLNIVDKLYPYPSLNLDDDRFKAIIERARKTLNKEF